MSSFCRGEPHWLNISRAAGNLMTPPLIKLEVTGLSCPQRPLVRPCFGGVVHCGSVLCIDLALSVITPRQMAYSIRPDTALCFPRLPTLTCRLPDTRSLYPCNLPWFDYCWSSKRYKYIELYSKANQLCATAVSQQTLHRIFVQFHLFYS